MSGFKRHRRSGACVATFTAFEADLLRSLAAQLIELLRNEAATGEERSDPLEDLLDFSGPTTEPDDPVLARLFPTAYPDDEEAAGDFRRFTESTLRDGKAGAAATIIDTLEEAGLPPEPEDGIFIDVELDRASRDDLDALLHRHAAGDRHPTRRRGGRRGLLGRPRRTTTPVPRSTTSTTGSATSRRPWSRPPPDPFRWLRSERQRPSRNHRIEWFRDRPWRAFLNHRGAGP